MFYDPNETPRPAPFTHNPFNALVAPRPIGWISTIDKDGRNNLAPFSFFNAVSTDPPLVMFAASARNAEGVPKDTFRNVREVPEFVVNVSTWELREKMNQTSAEYPPDVDEFVAAGLTPVASVKVRPFRVGEAKAALECTVHDIIDLPARRDGRRSHLVIGRVVGIYVHESVIVNGRIDASRLRQLSRLGYYDYSAISEVFQMPRPD